MGERLAREVRGSADLLIFRAIGEVRRYPRLGAAPFAAPVQPTATPNRSAHGGKDFEAPQLACRWQVHGCLLPAQSGRGGVVGPLENCAVSVYFAMVKMLQ